MKKLLSKVKRNKAAAQAAPSKITNDTIAEHREKVLADGRRYKYPFQYAKHKLVINAVIIVVAAVVVLGVITWQQLYVAQNSSNLLYRVTKLLPLPVAQVGDVSALYRDYLLNYRSPEHFLKNYWDTNQDSEIGKAQLEYAKRQALDTAIADAYARKIAGEKSLTVSEEEIDAEIAHIRSAGNGQLTVEAYDASAQKFLGMSPNDTREILRNGLLRSKVAFALDDKATTLKDKTTALLAKNSNDFDKVAALLNKEESDSVNAGVSGLIDRTDRLDGISAAEVANLPEGKTSEVLKSITGDGYYFVRVVEKTDRQVSFAFLQIPLKAFKQQLADLRSQGKIREYIKIDANIAKQGNEGGGQQ